jgi:alpha/beta superfamily hydrolase
METPVVLARPQGLLRGMLHLPDRRLFRPPWPGVVLYHGFGGHRMEAGFLFVRFSRLLSRHGIASVRFDFLGSGESDGEFQDMTLTGEIEDAGAVLDWFRRRRGLGRIFLLGLSMGGSVAGYLAGRRGSEVAGLLLWAPAGEMGQRLDERLAVLGSAQPVPRDPYDVNGLTLGEAFYRDAKGLRIMETSAHFPGPVLLAHGTADQTVSPEVAGQYERLYGGRARLARIDGADHVFAGADWSRELFQRSLRFLQDHAG